MDIHRIPTHVVRAPSYRNDAAAPPSPRRTARSNSQASDDAVHPRGAMTIPGARLDDAPPPLPPPRYNQELAHGIDVAWSWGNSNPFHYNKKHLAPIQPGSSLYGSYRESPRPSISLRSADDMDLDDDQDHRRGSTVSTIRSPSPSPAQSRIGGHVPSLIRKPPSPAPLNQRLHGDMPLAQQNINRSSQAYDQRLLSKIGKSNSPPRHQRSSSTESTAYAHKLSLQIKDSQGSFPSTNEPTAASFDPVSRWITSPVSAGLSPGARPGWRDYGLDHRSPSIDSAATSLVLDPELFVQPRASGLTSSVGSLLGTDDGASFVSHSQRGSYDQGIFAESEPDIATDEPEDHAFRNLNLGDSQQQVGRRSSKQGMKRRARSPPDVSRDDKSPSRGTPTELSQKLGAGSYTHSPISRYQPKHGSVSSTSSSVRHNSYASSIALSIAGSSMTSISSFDRLSPLDPSQPAYITSTLPVSSPATSIAPSRNLPTQLPLDAHSPIRKMSLQSAVNETRLPPATRIGNYFMCECCPKKPKKFDTEEELRAHQMEKQYTCQYCNNRFKNKNEAERHQNSLHLRRHSWSCAAIASYEAAFHSTTPPTASTPVSQTDSCGYCGEEFPNYPQPDWNRRIEHLTNVHKFGECNQAKKFFRADHFRQHLKHSHAGQSGKWTNMLETVCLREEFSQDNAGVSPTGSESSPGRGPSSLPDPPMGGATINEVQDET